MQKICIVSKIHNTYILCGKYKEDEKVKSNSIKKKVSLVLALVLAVAAGVAGTLAYLTSTTDEVENTFTVGNVKITLDEAKVNDAGVPVDADDKVLEAGADTVRVKANEYKLMPGHEYTKDPTIHVDKDSEDCWVFAKVENQLTAIEDATTIADQMTAKGWTLVTGTTNVYAYKEVVKANDNVVVFDGFKIKGDANVTDEEADYANKTINITGYAVQADGFDTAAAAWAAGNFA